MKSSILFGAGALGAHNPRQDGASTVDYTLEPGNLSTLANGSLFETWRPRAHVLPPFGQIGDPCGHYVDTETGSFHIGFLHNGAAGAITDDLVTYTDLNPDGAPFIKAGGLNDPVAVFDGTVINAGIDGLPTFLYTSVSYLPIQWTIAYTRGSETQSLAVSYDGGRNFAKLEQGPAIPAPPFAHDPGFQYWEELGQWWHEPANTTWGNGDWAGRWGFNFEVSNVFTLDEAGFSHDGTFFTTLGAEWSLDPIVPQVSDFRDSLWVSGEVGIENGEAKFNPTFAGKLDWGDSAYASHGQVVPATSQPSKKRWRAGSLHHDFNWTGALLLPRELSIGNISSVVDNELAREVGAWKTSSNESGIVELTTLHQQIAREPLAAMLNGTFCTEESRNLSSSDVVPFEKSPGSKFFVLQAAITFPSSARQSASKAGFQILASEHEATTVYYQFSNESIIVDRTNTSAAAKTTNGIDSRNEAGRLRLFDIAKNDEVVVETLELTIVVDNAVVEVHANGQFALSTWARSWYSNSTGIRFFSEGDDAIVFKDIIVHEGLYEAWPER
ncbi:hypothetical protein SCUP234_09641 [Seiridium cupressi]